MSQTTNALVKTNLNEVGRLIADSIDKELIEEGCPTQVNNYEFARMLHEHMVEATISFRIKDGKISPEYPKHLAKLVVFISCFFAKEGLDLDQAVDVILKAALES